MDKDLTGISRIFIIFATFYTYVFGGIIPVPDGKLLRGMARCNGSNFGGGRMRRFFPLSYPVCPAALFSFPMTSYK